MHIIRDLTAEKEMEGELGRLERLNLIGEMAASIGHEIRNPMTSIRGFLQMLYTKESYEEDRVFFDLMIEELDRANDIITEYLSIARDKKVELEPNFINDIVVSLYPMIQSDANYQEMNVKLDLAQTPAVMLNANEIRQMVLNMTRNAIDAMQRGGTLTIGTYSDQSDTVLYIQDEGCGLPPDMQDRLGTPFLTTKEKGTGLGLAVCRSIADRHNAVIDFKTGSQGTTFFIRFPGRVEQVLLF